ncbi:MAG: type secretory pathway component PulJ [Sphingomonas bacterium]|nr:type secretory pathway component PulJ [Sphingomonas bacterium]
MIARARSPVPPGEAGFTLVELMVSLMIFGMLAAAGVSLLSFSVRAQAASTERLREVSAIQRARSILTADLAQAAPRITRDMDGVRQPAFIGGTGAPGEVALAFVRRGWTNREGSPRASMQKVEYRVVEDRLERRAYPMLDGAAIGPPSVVIADVRGVRLRYRVGADWLDRWESTRPEAMPQVVEAVIDVPRFGEVRQLFLAGTGS